MVDTSFPPLSGLLLTKSVENCMLGIDKNFIMGVICLELNDSSTISRKYPECHREIILGDARFCPYCGVSFNNENIVDMTGLKYLPKNYSLLEKIENGLEYTFHDPQRKSCDEAMRFLIEQKLIQPNEHLQPNYWTLTVDGETELLAWRNKLAKAKRDKAEKEAEKAADEAAHFESETVRLQERKEDQANEERRYRGTNKVTIWTAIFTLVGGVIGILIQYYGKIVERIFS